MKYVKTLQIAPEDLEPYPGNAKIHAAEAMDESVKELGQFRSVLARQLDDGRIQLLAGHGTTEALQRAQVKKVRVEIVTASDDEALKIVLADNRIGQLAGYDESALAKLLEQLDTGAGFAGTGYDSTAYDDIMAKLAEAAAGVQGAVGGDNAWSSPTLADDRERYETKGTRTISLDYPHAVFVWLAEHFAILREEYEVDSNAELLVKLVEERTGSEAPSSLDDPAGPADAPEPSGLDEFAPAEDPAAEDGDR